MTAAPDTQAPAGGVTLAPLGGVLLRESRNEITRMLRMPQFVAPSVLVPGGFYALFALALGTGNTERATTSFLLYGIFAALGPALFGFGAGLAFDRDQGLLDAKRVAPVPVVAIVVGKLTAALMMTALALVPIFIAGAFAGVTLPPAALFAAIALDLASVVPFGLVGLIVGLSLPGKGAVAVANGLFLAFAVFGGLWFPAAMLPPWMQIVGAFTPAYHLGMLALALVGKGGDGSWLHFSALIIMILVSAVAVGLVWKRDR